MALAPEVAVEIERLVKQAGNGLRLMGVVEEGGEVMVCVGQDIPFITVAEWPLEVVQSAEQVRGMMGRLILEHDNAYDDAMHVLQREERMNKGPEKPDSIASKYVVSAGGRGIERK
jgi:hypothetical protein